MAFLELRTSDTIYYIQCITFYKNENIIEIQFFNGRRNQTMTFKKGINTSAGFIECYMNIEKETEYLNSIKKDNGEYLYKRI